MTALQRATEQARAEREQPGEVHHIADRQPAAKKTAKAAKKAPAKKTAKKTTRKRAG
jgi:DNA end-binding protein Ku